MKPASHTEDHTEDKTRPWDVIFDALCVAGCYFEWTYVSFVYVQIDNSQSLCYHLVLIHI